MQLPSMPRGRIDRGTNLGRRATCVITSSGVSAAEARPGLPPGGPGDSSGGHRPASAAAGGFGLDQERGDRPRPPARLVERHIQGIAHRDLPPLGTLDRLGEDLDPRLDRRPAHVGHLGRDLDPLADIDRRQEDHRVDRGGRDLPLARVPQRGDRPALVGQLQNDAAVERAERDWPDRAR